MPRELLLGCGNHRVKIIKTNGVAQWDDLVTLDIDPNCGADVIWDLNERPLPFADEEFDEIHAYEVLEHIGRQGDWRGFFAEFSEYFRILKPGGLLACTVPRHGSGWVWGDPGHTRYLGLETFVFLSRRSAERQVGNTAMTDYRHVWDGDFEVVWDGQAEHNIGVVMRRGVGRNAITGADQAEGAADG